MRHADRHRITIILAGLALAAAACGGTAANPSEAARADTHAATEPTSPGTTADDNADPSSDDSDRTIDVTADRTIEIEMTEFAFSPAGITVDAGETVRFVFTNSGAITHEAVLGSLHVQEEHETAMADGMDDHEGATLNDHEGEIPSVTVDPGDTAELVHTFTEAGELMFGCHLPGHWDAGMQATINVTG